MDKKQHGEYAKRTLEKHPDILLRLSLIQVAISVATLIFAMLNLCSGK